MTEAKKWLRTLPREEALKRAATMTEGVSRGKGVVAIPRLEVPEVKAEDHPFAHPRYWAAFILTGDPN